MSVRSRTFLTPWATPPRAKPAKAAHSVAPAVAPAIPAPWTAIAASAPAACQATGTRCATVERARDHAAEPGRHHQAVGGVGGLEHVLDVDDLGGDRHGEERERADRCGERDAQHAVVREVARAVPQRGRCRPPPRRSGARVAPRVHAARAGGDGEEARRVEQQRDLEGARGGQQRRRAAGRRSCRRSARSRSARWRRGSARRPRRGSARTPAGGSSAVPAPSSALSASTAASESVVKASAMRGRGLGERDARRAAARSPRGRRAAPRSRPSATLGPEQREEERRDGVGRARGRLDVERQRHPDEEVADRRQADGRHEQADVAEGEGAHVAETRAGAASLPARARRLSRRRRAGAAGRAGTGRAARRSTPPSGRPARHRRSPARSPRSSRPSAKG